MTTIMQFIDVDPNDHIVCVNISKTFDSKERADVYDCTRHYWRLNVSRADKANIVLAIVHGIVEAAYKPIRWYKSETYKGKTDRYEFDGVEIEDCPYIGKCVWNVINSKNQNPVSYINL